jgi:hypothetical protein
MPGDQKPADESREDRLARVLRRLWEVCAAMDADNQAERPTEEHYQAVMREARETLDTRSISTERPQAR